MAFKVNTLTAWDVQERNYPDNGFSVMEVSTRDVEVTAFTSRTPEEDEPNLLSVTARRVNPKISVGYYKSPDSDHQHTSVRVRTEGDVSVDLVMVGVSLQDLLAAIRREEEHLLELAGSVSVRA